MKSILQFILIQITILNLSCAWAQGFNAGVGFGKPSEFVFQSYKNQELISLKLLGAVKKAGVYHVPKNIELITLLSLAGGTARNADVEDILIGSKYSKKTRSVNLHNIIMQNYKKKIKFFTNDTVFVKRKRPFISDNSFKVISVLSVFLTAALTAIVINEKI